MDPKRIILIRHNSIWHNTTNPMLVRLQRKIEEQNKNVQQTIDKVATLQKFITVWAIAIN